MALELGGKGANLVFADADDKAVVRGARHCFYNSGQSCNAPTRMLVERAEKDGWELDRVRIAHDGTRRVLLRRRIIRQRVAFLV